MTQHAEKKWLPFSAEQLFTMVADVEQYPKFLPWCTGVWVRERTENTLRADMAVGYHFFQERFTSHVSLVPFNTIEVVFEEGPFRYLNNRWQFIPENKGCLVDFFIDFEIKAFGLQAFMSTVFDKAAHRMLHAFEKRAHQLYGAEDAPRPVAHP